MWFSRRQQSDYTPEQWGFRPIVSALLDAVHSWSEAIDQGKEVCTIFFILVNLTPWLHATKLLILTVTSWSGSDLPITPDKLSTSSINHTLPSD